MSETERYLLDQVRAGRPEAWAQLVEGYQGRLLSFARRQLGQDADAEDAVQETFVRFLRSVERFRADASIETYLFTILRRHIIDQYRGRDRRAFTLGDAAGNATAHPFDAMPAGDLTASWHARAGEQQAWMTAALGEVIAELTDRLRREQAFDQLQALELLFAAQVPNHRLAELLDIPPPRVGVIKHRWLKRIATGIAQRRGDAGDATPDDGAAETLLLERDSLLTRVWHEQRPTCPKRTTLGQYLLGTLDNPWTDYVRFHLHTLGCTFCRANLDDLEAQTAAADGDAALRERIMASTAGFLRGRG